MPNIGNAIRNYIDTHLVPSTLITLTISLGITYISALDTHMDWRVFGWLKIPRTEPFEKWYDDRHLKQTFTRPPLSLYFHYLLSYIFSFIDPVSFNSHELSMAPEHPPYSMEVALRLTVIAANLMTYYPVVIFVVLKIMKTSPVKIKLFIMLLLLNAPVFGIADYLKLDMIGPTMALVLLAIYFVYTDCCGTSIAMLTLGMLMDLKVLYLFIPFITYILSSTRHKMDGTKVGRLIKIVGEILKMMTIFSLITGVILYPFLANDQLRKNMMRAILDPVNQLFARPAPTVWMLIKMLLGNIDVEQFFHIWVSNPYIYSLLAAPLILLPIVFNPTKQTFLCGLVTFNTFFYIFGYNVHDYDLHYVLMPMLLLQDYYKGYYSTLMAISAAVMYPYCCLHAGESVAQILSVIFFFVSLGLDYTEDPSRLPVMVSDEELAMQSRLSKKLSRAFNYLYESSAGFLFGVLSMIITMYALYVNANRNYSYWCSGNGIIEEVTLRACFMSLLILFGYSWLSLYVCSRRPSEPVGAKEKFDQERMLTPYTELLIIIWIKQ
eukprot:TRINITY_DN65_c0_g2_i1.p1 TRINITY_DN65_c0_g2~~TRINITY_DN65_c0_g2_i1.p1  ORF type:complete len:588 (-),score=9.29 TRINITY_DN65_c0_g2_i1:1817-3463(-)